MRVNSLFSLLIAPVAAIGTCYTTGPAFPPADHFLSSKKGHFKELGLKLDFVVKEALKNPHRWNTSITSFAAQITTSRQTIWSNYYTAPLLGEYKDSEPSSVTGDTNFRIASISKSFTVYAILLENEIGLDDPITKYIPELLDWDGPEEQFRVWYPDWEKITIRSLASQLSGIAREGGLSDLAVDTALLPNPVARGFPPVVEERLFPCMKNSTDRPCTASEIIGRARNRTKVFEANDRSTYSNVAFSLLGQVLERATGKDYAQIIAASITGPLGMDNTTIRKPKDSDGIIPWGPVNDWAQDLGPDTPSGGIYSTANDFSKYLRSILSSSLLPIPTRNAWMKPHSWTSGTNSAYGMPWEILRTTKLTPDGRVIDIVTKGGALTGYFSTIAQIPEFGLGITLLVAGDSAAKRDLQERIIATVVPEVEKIIREEVRQRYAGFWVGIDDLWGPPDKNFLLGLEVDETGPGIRVSKWISNGTDFLSVYGELKGMPADQTKWSARLIPTGVYHEDEKQQNFVEPWRLTAIPQQDPKDNGKVFDDECFTDVDAMMYDGASIEEFSIVGNIGGETYALWNPGMQLFMVRCTEWDHCENVAGKVSSLQALEKKVKENIKQKPLTFER